MPHCETVFSLSVIEGRCYAGKQSLVVAIRAVLNFLGWCFRELHLFILEQSWSTPTKKARAKFFF